MPIVSGLALYTHIIRLLILRLFVLLLKLFPIHLFGTRAWSHILLGRALCSLLVGSCPPAFCTFSPLLRFAVLGKLLQAAVLFLNCVRHGIARPVLAPKPEFS